MIRRIGRLHVITDTAVQNRYSPAQLADLAIRGGADTIQYRSKSLSVREMIAEATSVRAICARAGVLFLVNDRIDVCQAVDADGVHLGQHDMPIDVARRVLGLDKIIGGTARNSEDIGRAHTLGADYVGLGPVFATASKTVAHTVLGLSVVRSIAAASALPIIAISGITLDNVAATMQSGVHGIAVISAVCAANDVTRATIELRAAIDATVGERR